LPNVRFVESLSGANLSAGEAAACEAAPGPEPGPPTATSGGGVPEVLGAGVLESEPDGEAWPEGGGFGLKDEDAVAIAAGVAVGRGVRVGVGVGVEPITDIRMGGADVDLCLQSEFSKAVADQAEGPELLPVTVTSTVSWSDGLTRPWLFLATFTVRLPLEKAKVHV
jgi:hypothetical protein